MNDRPDNGWPDYAELHCLSAFSFQRGASVADELFDRAKALGYRALAITDECSLTGIVRAWQSAKTTGVRLVAGCRLDLADGASLLVYPIDRPAWSRLTRLLSNTVHEPSAEGCGLIGVAEPEQRVHRE